MKNNKAVIYARYSSDLQKKTSIDDQVRNCKKMAAKHGYDVTEIYADEGVSGTSTNRPSYQRMIQDAHQGKFNVLIIDDLSRMHRDAGHSMVDLGQMKYQGIQVLSVSEDYDSLSEGSMAILIPALKGAMDQIYIDELAKKTRRGQEGQFERGFSTGGAVYGYKTVPVYGSEAHNKKSVVGYKYQIVKDEAEAIKLIFKLYVDGHTPRKIAHELNDRGIKSPSGKDWGASTIQPNLKKSSGLLLQPMYNGQRVWNKTHFIKNPTTGRRKPVTNPMSEWKFSDDSELRIIDSELWAKTQNRIKNINRQTELQRNEIKKSGGRRPGGSLLSGLLKCPCCGGNLIVSGRNHFACSTAKNKGTCENRTHLKKSEIENQLLTHIIKLICTQENIERYKKEVLKELKKAASTDPSVDLKSKLKKIDKEIENLTQAVQDGMKFEFVKDKLSLLDSEKQLLERELSNIDKSSGKKSAESVELNFRKELEETISSLKDYKENMPKSRELLSRLVGNRIIVKEIKKASEYEASFKVDPTKLVSDSSCQGILVAGAGFEPTTFGL